MARVTGVPINYLLTRGQMIKVASQLFRKVGCANVVTSNETTIIRPDLTAMSYLRRNQVQVANMRALQ